MMEQKNGVSQKKANKLSLNKLYLKLSSWVNNRGNFFE